MRFSARPCRRRKLKSRSSQTKKRLSNAQMPVRMTGDRLGMSRRVGAGEQSRGRPKLTRRARARAAEPGDARSETHDSNLTPQKRSPSLGVRRSTKSSSFSPACPPLVMLCPVSRAGPGRQDGCSSYTGRRASPAPSESATRMRRP